jgi:glucose/mannose-6-phosphate isomerase
MASASDLPLFAVPPGPVPRTALGALMAPVLLTLSRAGILPDAAAELDGVGTALSRRRDALVGPGGPAEQVARLIGRTIPLVYGSEGLTAVAARRWKTQINENAKTPAFFAVQPELSHNEVAGWGQHGDVTRQVLSLVTLRHAGEHPQVARRFDLVIDATDEVMAQVIPVWAEGDDDLGRFFDLALFGDLVSLHMAGREGLDPGPVPALSDVESALRR